MGKYFDTGLITVGEDKDRGLISSSEDMDIYDIEKISKFVDHRIERLTVINEGPGNINIISKIGYRWSKIVLSYAYARLVKNMTELRVEAHKGTKYRVTEFILVINGTYLDRDGENMNMLI